MPTDLDMKFYTSSEVLAAVKYGFNLERNCDVNIAAADFLFELQKDYLNSLPVPCSICGKDIPADSNSKVYVDGCNTTHNDCVSKLAT